MKRYLGILLILAACCSQEERDVLKYAEAHAEKLRNHFMGRITSDVSTLVAETQAVSYKLKSLKFDGLANKFDSYLDVLMYGNRTLDESVKDYNKGLLTVLGICVKHGITPSVAQALLYSENNANIKRRHGKQHKKDKKLVIDVLTKSSEEIEQKYGYTSVYVDEMKRFVNQWSLLTKGQKKAFSKIMRKKVLPSKYVLASIERSTDRNANEKFDRILFALVSTREEIIEKYGISRKTANRLIREMEFWKILSRKEEPVKDFA